MPRTSDRAARFLLLSILLLVPLGCGDESTGPAAGVARVAAVLPNGAEVVKGSTESGALYGLYLPVNWNGALVLYAHGFVPHGTPLFQVPDIAPAACDDTKPGINCVALLRDRVLAQGYGFAWSSFSENGVAIKDGAQHTGQLIGLFSDAFAHPKHVYLWSHSMGAAAIMHMIEQNPQRFAGGLPVCGIIAGTQYQFSYYYSVRVLFDYFFPGVMPPPALSSTGMNAPAVVAAISANSTAAQELGAIDQLDMHHTNGAELVTFIMNALTFQSAPWFGAELSLHTHNRLFFDNASVRYTGSSDDDALNAGVGRFRAHPDAINIVRQWYQPRGNLRVPVLSLNTVRDPVVPIGHQAAYQALADASSASTLFLPRAIDRLGHCASTVAEELTAFGDLVTWATTGTRPTN